MIRKATVQDVPAIAALINQYAERGIMLFRSHAELYETVRDFIVAEENNTILGIAALEIIWADLAEVRSLAVAPSAQNRGLGRQLVSALADEARHLKIQRIFALTYEKTFFERQGFVEVDKSALPLKVWSVCIKCPKRDGCDEIAMVKTILDAPSVAEDNPDTHADLRYDVPTPLVQLGVKH